MFLGTTLFSFSTVSLRTHGTRVADEDAVVPIVCTPSRVLDDLFIHVYTSAASKRALHDACHGTCSTFIVGDSSVEELHAARPTIRLDNKRKQSLIHNPAFQEQNNDTVNHSTSGSKEFRGALQSRSPASHTSLGSLMQPIPKHGSYVQGLLLTSP